MPTRTLLPPPSCAQHSANVAHSGSPSASPVSTLGFLSQGILTAPRVYYAMARDGLFFKSVGWLSPKTGAPVVAIILQGIAATIIALSGRYEQILNYVVSIDFISFALTAASLFVFRRRDKSPAADKSTPGAI